MGMGIGIVVGIGIGIRILIFSLVTFKMPTKSTGKFFTSKFFACNLHPS
jgi:hypothetical protein